MIIALMLSIIHIGAINYVHGILAFGFFAIFLYQPYKRRRLDMNAMACSEILMLILFGMTYVLFGEISTLYLEYYLIAPVLTFMAGWCCCECAKDSWDVLHRLLFAILIGYGVHVALNVSVNIGNTRLEMRDYFQGLRIATGSGALNTMILSLVMYLVFLAKGVERGVLCVLLGLSAVYCLMLGTRTQIVILAFVFICMYSMFVFEKNGILGVLKVIGVVFAVAAVAFIVYMTDIFGIGTAINKSNLMKRFVINDYSRITEGNASMMLRIQLLEGAFGEIAKHPFGGNIDATYYHNFFLDIARVSGIIPMVFMIVYMLKMVANLLTIYRQKEKHRIRYMIISVYMGFWLNFMAEPVLEGLLESFLMMCLLDGMVTYIARREIPQMSQQESIEDGRT